MTSLFTSIITLLISIIKMHRTVEKLHLMGMQEKNENLVNFF